MESETILTIIIISLVIVIAALIVNYSILPNYKQRLQQETVNTIAFTQARDRLLFYPAQTQDNQTVIQSITWQELCQGLGG